MLSYHPISEQLSDRPSAHCATLVELPDSTLLAAWYAGAYETAADVAILAARYDPASESWRQPYVIADIPGRSLGQPVLFVHPAGDLWLLFNVIVGRGWTSAQPYLQRSSDFGRTWENPQPLIDYPGLMFRSRAHLLSGRIIVPVYDETSWQSRMLISDDYGETWHLTAPISTSSGNIQPCLAQLSDQKLLAYLRTGGDGGVIWRTESLDGGETWAEPAPTHIPNPNSGIDLLRLRSGSLALAFNNSPRQRTPLCVALSIEDERWQWGRTLEDEQSEFSYPTLLQSADERIHIVYTYRRRHIQHAIFTEKWLKEEQLVFTDQD